MPTSASFASPGPLTSQPITATFIGVGSARRRSSATFASGMRSMSARPHEGHATSVRPRSRRPRDFRRSNAALTSITGSSLSETRMVSPIPSYRSTLMPAAERIDPESAVPASVTPRCSGYGTAFARRRYAAIITGTSKAFTETTMSSKSRSSRIRISERARSTIRWASSRTSPGWRSPIEPWFTPIRIGVPCSFARLTT